MSSTIVFTESAPKAVGPYSQAVMCGNMLFVSGQLGLDPTTGKLVGPDLESQASQALHNLLKIVTAAGFALTDIVSVDVFLTQMGLFKTFNQVYSTVFSEHRPARAVVEVSALPIGAVVEVKCVAMR
jgi:2-iminobutanoate/2-iminopropanoate deaminase